MRAFSLASRITQRDTRTGIRTSPGSHILWRPGDRDSAGGLHRGVPPGPALWRGPARWMIPAGVPAVRELAPGSGLTGMQTGGTDGIRASGTRFPPLILCAVTRDQLRRRGVMDPCAMHDGRVPPLSQSRVTLSAADEGGSAGQQRRKRKRVRPPGSAAKVTIAERGSIQDGVSTRNGDVRVVLDLLRHSA